MVGAPIPQSSKERGNNGGRLGTREMGTPGTSDGVKSGAPVCADGPMGVLGAGAANAAGGASANAGRCS